MEKAFMLKYLSRSRVPEETLEKVIIPHLQNKGFRKVEDLEELELKFLDREDITDLDKNRIMKLITSKNAPLVTVTTEVAKTTDNIYLRYIFCCESLFSTDVTEIRIEDIDQHTPLIDILNKIHQDHKLTEDCVIEMYCSEGYPLHNNNEITNKESLIKWGIEDGDLFYIFSRYKTQTGQLQFATLPKVDHDIGQETFIIESPFCDKFEVNAYIDSDSPEDIAQKIYSITDIPVPYMTLFVRRNYEYERLTTFTELEDENIIRVVLRNPQEVATPRTPHYGQYSYKPLVPQSELGISKFYSILKFLCSPQPYNKEYDFEKLLTYLMNLTNFPPLVHALCTLREQSYLTIPGWTALVEGCYYLFKTILNDHVTIPNYKVFEYSDYMWSLLIYMSKSISDISVVECEQLSLVCPLSGVKICNPVRIASQGDVGPFDRENILAKINESETFEQFGIPGKVSKESLQDDEIMARLLMYYSWETDDKIFVWIRSPQPTYPMVCKKTGIQTTWNHLINCLSELSIVHPLGLYAGSECLTYIHNGRLTYFLGASKGTDETRRIYDPISKTEGYICSFSKRELQDIGNLNLDDQVSCDLTRDLKVNITDSDQLMATSELRKSAIIQPQKSIQWTPEEAIVVVLDKSGSMGSSIYSTDLMLRRVDAAKELFSAFATRTQAYKLHHSFGLTVFDNYVNVKLPITENIENFEQSLHNIEPGGGTNLTGAIINAVRQLKQYTCVRRILCLTDGKASGYSRTYEEVKRNNVVVDTVLLTSSVSIDQKNLSHASGGVCVLPKSMREALRFFEMDAMLSLKERNIFIKHHPDGSLPSYNHTSCETEDSFTSCYVQTFQLLQTISTKRYIDQDRSVFQINVSPLQRRIMKELQYFRSNPVKDIKVYPCEDEFNKWKALMKGPENTAYQNGAFVLSLEFPDKYPSVPPQVRFLTPIYHCNISGSSGRICHSILGESYTPSTSLKDILCHIYGLLMCPEIDSPLDSILAEEYGYLKYQEKDWTKPFDVAGFFNAADTYFENARRHVALYANKTFDELDRELAGDASNFIDLCRYTINSKFK